MTTDQVLLGVGLIMVLAVGSQVLAARLRIPALIILLPAGFIAGALTSDVNPQRLLGAAFQPLVSLAVAVILYDAGMSLDLRKLRGHTRQVVIRLITWGVPITWAFAAASAALLLGMSTGAALMTGAILVVSGPTVVAPLLRFVRPTDRLQRVLGWEGSLTLFGADLTRYDVGHRYAGGAKILTLPAADGAPAGSDLLFLVRANGALAPVTHTSTPSPREGDTMILLGSAPRIRNAEAAGSC